MRFIRKIKNVLQVFSSLRNIKIKPNEVIHVYNNDGTPYGVCGYAYATQVELNRQIEYKPIKAIEYKLDNG